MQHHILGMQLDRDTMLPCRPADDISPLSMQRRNGRARSGMEKVLSSPSRDVHVY